MSCNHPCRTISTSEEPEHPIVVPTATTSPAVTEAIGVSQTLEGEVTTIDAIRAIIRSSEALQAVATTLTEVCYMLRCDLEEEANRPIGYYGSSTATNSSNTRPKRDYTGELTTSSPIPQHISPLSTSMHPSTSSTPTMLTRTGRTFYRSNTPSNALPRL